MLVEPRPARIDLDRPPAPFLINDYLHQMYVRPPLLLVGQGNLEAGRRVRDRLLDLVCERNDVKPGLKEVLATDMYDEPGGRYPDGHTAVKIHPACTQRPVFILQNAYPNPDTRLMEVFQMADAARRAGATDITAILPYYPYGRDDRKTQPRVPISASLVANLLTASGVNRIITEDIHAEQTTGSIQNPWDNLYASTVFIPELREMINPRNTVMMSPDAGGLKRANAYKKRLGAVGVAFVMKNRELNEEASNPEAVMFVGDVKNREVVLIDDESVSLSSLYNGAWAAADGGAEKIVILLSHLKYAEESQEHEKMLERMGKLPPQTQAILTTDSVALPPEVVGHPLVKVIDTSPFWSEIIWRTTFGMQLSPDLID